MAKQEYRVLYVDDSDDDRVLLRRYLTKEGIRVDLAADGVSAENHLRNTAYDLVITDLRMPRKHGHSLVLDLAKTPGSPPVVVFTGIARKEIVQDLFARGVIDVIQKAGNFEIIALKIKSILERLSATGAPGRSPSNASNIAEQIGEVTSQLDAQLAQVTASFEATIATLKSQQSELRTGFVGSLRVLANLMNHMQESDGSHVGRVEEIAVFLAQRLGLSEDEQFELRLAALLHEVGQFGMPDEIRRKQPGELTEKEWESFRRYPILGAALVSEISGGEAIARVIEAHAENFDGTGFPNALARKDIPMRARILRVADGLDSFRMATGKADDAEAVQQHLEKERGTAYDPEIIPFAVAYLSEEEGPRATEEVGVYQLSAGDMLAENLYDQEGHFLMRAGAELTASNVQRLRNLLPDAKVLVYADSRTPA